MAYFHISPGTPSLKLPSSRRGEFSFTVTNNLGRPARVQASVLPEGGAKPEWLSIEGAAERDLTPTETQTFVVQVQLPRDVPVGEQRFKLLVASVARPDDEYDTSPPVAFTIPEAAQARAFPWWIVIVAAGILVIAVGGFFLYRALRRPEPGMPAKCAAGVIGDVNGDRRADFVCSETSQGSRIYAGLGQANGTFQFLPFQDRAEQDWSAYKTLVADVNGDRRADLIWNQTGQGNRVYVGLGRANGTFEFLPFQDRTEQGWSGYKTLAGDVNGDGRADLVWNETGQGNRTYVGLGEANGTFQFLPFQDRAEQGWSAYKTLAGDVNGDGRADLIWNETGQGNRTYVGLGQANGTFQFLPFQDRTEQGWNAFETLVGDMNGDRRADLIWNETGQGNRTYVGLGQADGTFQFLPFQDRTEQGWSAFKTLAGDVNGDGRADLIWNATGQGNRTYVGLGQADGTFQFLPFQDHTGQDWSGYETLVGDVNGDGRADLIWNETGQGNHIYVGLGQANGTFQFLPQQARTD